MSIYSNQNYRKIYEEYYGPIPSEPNGRTYEIHHIDGNHSNNNPLNLVAVTLQEHYDIHYSQGDYSACGLMVAQRFNRSPEEITEESRWLANKLVEEGRHPFLGGAVQSKANADRILNNTHNFLGSSGNLTRISNGTHPSQIKVCCLECKTVSSVSNFKKHHGDMCGIKKTHKTNKLITCPHCSKEGRRNMQRYHFTNCKSLR